MNEMRRGGGRLWKRRKRGVTNKELEEGKSTKNQMDGREGVVFFLLTERKTAGHTSCQFSLVFLLENDNSNKKPSGR